MVLKGAFQSISIAVYGEIAPAFTSTTLSYSPKPLPNLKLPDLPSQLDPCLSNSLTGIANGLLALDSDTPDVKLITQLMFSMKPLDEDWDEPNFPYLYANLRDIDGLRSPKQIIKILSRPISDNTGQDRLRRLASRMVESVDTEDSVCSAFLLLENLY